MTIADNLKKERGGMTQSDLARASGVSQKTISAIELGRIKFPTYQTAFKLANVLACDPSLFIQTNLPIKLAAKPEKEPEVKMKQSSNKLAALKNKLGTN